MATISKSTSQKKSRKKSVQTSRVSTSELGPKKFEPLLEKGPRIYRNFNLVVGSVALAGALITPPVVAVALGAYAGLNFIQAGAGEGLRRLAKNRSKRKSKKKLD